MPKQRTYLSIEQEIKKLEAQATAMRKNEVKGVVSRIKEAIASYGLTLRDLGFEGAVERKAAAKTMPAQPTRKKAKRAASKVAIKYRDQTGNTWTGRGSQPRWLKAAVLSGAKLQDFAV